MVCFSATLLCAAQRRNRTQEVKIKPILVVYKTVGDVELKLHIFEPPDRQSKEPVPAIVFFFGGGWTGGTPTQFYHQSDYLASRGMMAISAEYRIKSKHGTTPFECVADGKSAIRWVRANASGQMQKDLASIRTKSLQAVAPPAAMLRPALA